MAKNCAKKSSLKKCLTQIYRFQAVTEKIHLLAISPKIVYVVFNKESIRYLKSLDTTMYQLLLLKVSTFLTMNKH